jgi:GxxExxY protein
MARTEQQRQVSRTISREIVDAAMKVHAALGPGLLESAYTACLAFELRRRGLGVVEQHPVSVAYGDTTIEVGYRIDLLVEDDVIVELKAVAKLLPIHEAQVLSYLRLSQRTVALLINFHVLHLKDGIRRFVNNW